MPSDTRKNLLPLQIITLLKTYSDQDHRLTQRDILDLLKREFDVIVDRKTVARNIKNLIDFGFNIEYSETTRSGADGEEQSIVSGLYFVHEFSDSELRLLIDSLLFSKHIPHKQRQDLIKKLEGLSSKYFSVRVRHVSGFYEPRTVNRQLFFSIDMLDSAISENKQVRFRYGEYGTDKKLRPRLNSKGFAGEYTVNPYQMVAANGRYYLIGNMDKFDRIAYFRMDRIMDICILDSKAKPMKDVEGLENGLDLPRHMAEHIYMFSGESIHARFVTHKSRLNDILDWFEMDVGIKERAGDKLEVTVLVNAEAMYYWCLQYGQHIELLEPTDLRGRLAATTKEMAAKYNQSHDNA